MVAMPASRSEAPSQGWLGEFSRRDWLTAGLLAALVVVFYIPALRAGFVWDDSIFVQEPDLQKRSGLHSVWLSPADLNGEAHYWPVTYSTLWLEHQLWGLNPLGYHITNIVLHLLNSLLVWRLMMRLRVPGAAIIGAVFAVHPLHVESVAWIIERKDVLSALFYLSAVLVWMRFNEAPRLWRYVLTLGLYIAGLLAKSVVVTLPAALLIWRWREQGRITRTDLARLGPLFATGLVITLADLSFYASREPLDLGYSALERAMIAVRSLWFYVAKILWPSGLDVIYPHWDVSSSNPLNWVLAAAGAGLVALLWLGRRRLGRGPLAGVMFFAVTLSPTLGFVEYGYMQFSFVADRFQYLAGIGVMAVMISACTRGARLIASKADAHEPTAKRSVPGAEAAGESPPSPHRDRPPLRARLAGANTGIAWTATAAIVVVLGVLTWRQASLYENQVTLFSHIVERNPQARLAHANLGAGYLEAGRYEEAVEVTLIALERHRDDAGLYANLALGYVELGEFDQAEQHMREALELEPNSAQTRFKMGNLLRAADRHEEAVEQYLSVLEIDDQMAAAYAGMGVSLSKLERQDEALEALERSLELDPSIPQIEEVHRYSGLAARRLGDLETAAHHYARVFEIDPLDGDVALELSAMLATLGRAGEADAYLREARALQPEDADAQHQFKLGERLRSQHRHEQAIAAYRAALERDPDHADAHAGLGESLHRVDQHDEAISTMSRALELGVKTDTAATLHFLIAEAAQRVGRHEEAIRQLESALELDPEFVEALDSLARLHFDRQDYDQALLRFEAAAEARPDAASITNVGVVLFHMGRREEALASLDEALALDASYETAIANRAEVLRAIEEARNTQDPAG